MSKRLLRVGLPLALTALTTAVLWKAGLVSFRSISPVSDRQVISAGRFEVRSPASAPASVPATESVPATSPTLFASETLGADVRGRAERLNLPVDGDAVKAVMVDPALFTGKRSPFWQPGSEVRVPLFGGAEAVVTVRTTEFVGAQAFVSEGEIAGQPGSRAIFSYTDGAVSGKVELPPGDEYALMGTAEGSLFYRVDRTRLPACGGAPVPTDKPAALAERARRVQLAAARASRAEPASEAGAEEEGGRPVIAAAAAPANATVRILVLYTPEVRSWAGSAPSVHSTINSCIATLNSDLQRSGVNQVRVQLAVALEVNYPETGSDGYQREALERLRKTDDGHLDSIHALRDQYAADLVCLMTRKRDNKSSGIAYQMNAPGDMGSVYNHRYGFSVVDYSLSSSSGVFSHEIGHNFGCAHARGDGGSSESGAYPYSYGHRFTDGSGWQYRTLMAYSPGERVNYFSNPRLKLPYGVGQPALGRPEGAADAADNARTIEQTGFEVASYRLSNDAPYNRGTLVNVSTRATIPAGRELIGGFVVNGTQSKNILIRAGGPSLQPFGVGNFHPNPAMTLFRTDGPSSVIVASNDNWNQQSPPFSAATVRQIMQQTAPGFPFAEGSADAALYLTLSPGLYTANVSGAGGSVGNAIVEAYEVGSTASQLVNLSTRGYVGKDADEMTAGFVISGLPGQRKRVLITTLGPSLLSRGISNVATDPAFRIYDQTSRQIIDVDDWSADSQETRDTYMEQRIYETGFYPRDRREPAVLLDLEPGAYTVVVRPFERLPDVPGEPGEALVEVYEIP